jgi:hypothetical protein
MTGPGSQRSFIFFKGLAYDDAPHRGQECLI